MHKLRDVDPLQVIAWLFIAALFIFVLVEKAV